MHKITKEDIKAVSGGSLQYIDLFAIWAGYNQYSFKNTLIVGAAFNAAIGMMAVSSSPLEHGVSKFGVVAATAGFGAAFATVNYMLGQYASGLVEDHSQAS
jgi:hypothetical protein